MKSKVIVCCVLGIAVISAIAVAVAVSYLGLHAALLILLTPLLGFWVSLQMAIPTG